MSVRSPALRQPRTRTGLTAWAGIAASLAGVVLLAVPGRGPRLAGAFLLACVPVGAAVMCWVDSGEGIVQAGLTLVVSLAATAIVSAAMIWLTVWQPSALYAFAVIGVASGAARLLRGGHPCCAERR
jgi:drug/metabolite transporter (DMT)-like permease